MAANVAVIYIYIYIYIYICDINAQLDENIMSIKNMIIDALKEENLKLQNKVKKSNC